MEQKAKTSWTPGSVPLARGGQACPQAAAAAAETGGWPAVEAPASPPEARARGPVRLIISAPRRNP